MHPVLGGWFAVGEHRVVGGVQGAVGPAEMPARAMRPVSMRNRAALARTQATAAWAWPRYSAVLASPSP